MITFFLERLLGVKSMEMPGTQRSSRSSSNGLFLPFLPLSTLFLLSYLYPSTFIYCSSSFAFFSLFLLTTQFFLGGNTSEVLALLLML